MTTYRQNFTLANLSTRPSPANVEAHMTFDTHSWSARIELSLGDFSILAVRVWPDGTHHYVMNDRDAFTVFQMSLIVKAFALVEEHIGWVAAQLLDVRSKLFAQPAFSTLIDTPSKTSTWAGRHIYHNYHGWSTINHLDKNHQGQVMVVFTTDIGETYREYIRDFRGSSFFVQGQ